MSRGSRRRRTAALLLAVLALGLPATPASAATRAADPVVDAISANATPHVSIDGAPVVLSGIVAGRDLPAAGLPVVVRRAPGALPDRDAVAEWAQTSEPATGAVLASGRTIRTNGVTAFRLPVETTRFGSERPYGVVPISIEVGGRSIHSFLPFHQRKEYEPLRLSFAVPVVGATDPRKYGSAQERLAAWTAEADPAGRLRRLLAAVSGVPVTLLIDPALLDPGATPEPATATTTTVPTPTPSAPAGPTTYAASAEEVQARTGLADAIRAATTGGSVLRLPGSDPDVASAAADGGARALVTERVRADPAQDTVLWPADGSWSAATEGAVDGLDPARTAIAIADSSWLRATAGESIEATHRTRGGTRLLVSDHGLATRLASTVDGSGVQAFLADTIALLAERPGTARSYVVVLPRSVAAAPAWVDALTSALAAPWVEGAALPTVAQSRSATVVTPGTRPPPIAASPLARGGTALEGEVRALRAAATVRADSTAYLARWDETARGLTSTGWRGDAAGWSTLAAAVRGESSDVAAKLTVPARDINFLADSGRIRIVVSNGLDVPVRGLRLRLIPESPRLRIDSAPVELEIGAESQATATVAATALAAGDVSIRAVLLTPAGDVLSSSTNVRIRVTPTGAVIYWVVGGLALLVLALGVLRSRRRRRAVAAPAGTLPA